MRHGSASTARAKLGAFLDAYVGTAQCDDIGALLGQAALYYDHPMAGEAIPADGQNAISAALAGGPGPSSARKAVKRGQGVRPH
jgi:hypothetical protein